MSAEVYIKQQKITNVSKGVVYIDYYDNDIPLDPGASVVISLNESYKLKMLALDRKITIEFVDVLIGKVNEWQQSTISKFEFIND